MADTRTMAEANRTLEQAHVRKLAMKLEADEIHAAAKTVHKIVTRYANGREPSIAKDGPVWDAAVKVLDKAGILAPSSGNMCWRD